MLRAVWKSVLGIVLFVGIVAFFSGMEFAKWRASRASSTSAIVETEPLPPEPPPVAPSISGSSASIPPPPAPRADAPPCSDCDGKCYGVQRGDTLSALAIRFYRTLKVIPELKVKNKIDHPKEWIFTESCLCLPNKLVLGEFKDRPRLQSQRAQKIKSRLARTSTSLTTQEKELKRLIKESRAALRKLKKEKAKISVEPQVKVYSKIPATHYKSHIDQKNLISINKPAFGGLSLFLKICYYKELL